MFKVTIKTLRKESFEVQIDPADTVLVVKHKIESQKPELAADLQRLVFAGKELKDESTVTAAEIVPDSTIVVMMRKPKTTTGPVQSAAAVETPSPSAPTPATAATTRPQPPAAAQTPQAAIAPQPAPQAASGFLSGEALDTMVRQLMEITGKDADEVQSALRAAFFNPDRAVEYLFSGIPANLQQAAQAAPQQAAPQEQAAAQQAPPQQAAPQQAAPQAAGQDPFGNLRSHPQVLMLRQLVQSEPQLEETILQELRNSHPQFRELITNRHADVVRMLREPLTNNEQQLVNRMMAQMASVGEDGEGAGQDIDMADGEPDMPQQHVVQLSQEESAAVHRLMELGFPEQVALEAYLACDKNEMLAANYLFTNPQ
jgi:UV excision repair protein RAD23